MSNSCKTRASVLDMWLYSLHHLSVRLPQLYNVGGFNIHKSTTYISNDSNPTFLFELRKPFRWMVKHFLNHMARPVALVWQQLEASQWVTCLSSQPQAYLQQAQDLVILESIILQTLGKFGRKNWVPTFPPETHVIIKIELTCFTFVHRNPISR